jgi:uncharacterized protein (DUF2235 family)
MSAVTRRDFSRRAMSAGLGLAGLMMGCSRSMQSPRASTLSAPEPGPKALVVCQDGTWDSFDGHLDASATASNVAKLYAALVDDDPRQVKYYHDGVGQFGDRVLGGDLGAGTSKRIMAAYEFLSTNYADGDRIYLFGFSRGAFAVRSLASFIDKCGLVNAARVKQEHGDLHARIGEAYEVYLSCHNPAETERLRLRATTIPACPVEMVGVWDTVGSLGAHVIKLPLAQRLVEGLHDVEPHESLRHGYHALAIDERREDFYPTPWGRPRHGLEEVWFAGVHSNVGGGYADSRLSDIALNWMMAKAQCHGLRFTKALVPTTLRLGGVKDRYGLEESLKPGMAERIRLGDGHQIPRQQMVHWSVPRLIDTTGYAPRNVGSASMRDVYRITPDDDGC